ncbi:hypothetical protein ACHAXA_009966 [Cyclostephanos tholiformis]|uniref:Oxidation resistance protein 1 n=1 Tax=Cyclostephanos tholiformis TaxID=382380 RepID=A0ABD3R8J5_9STRA
MSVTKDDELELLARLQAQFGDIDVKGMLQVQTEVMLDEESESSLEEPTAEELRAWQEAQFAKGKMRQVANKLIASVTDGNMAPQLRRHNKTTSQLTLMREDEKNEEADEWVKVTSIPDLGGKASVFFPTAVKGDALKACETVNPLLQKLAEGDPEVLGTKWDCLYSSSEGDGLSFRNVCEKIRGYEGPTVLLIGGIPSASKFLVRTLCSDAPEKVSLGFFTTDTWIQSTDYFGSDDCFLFSMDGNDVQFIRPKSRSLTSTSTLNNKYMYCHPSSLATSNKRLKDAPQRTNASVHGIGIGGTASQPRLHITESLEECRALSYDLLFDDGDLLSGKCSDSLYYFDVDCIEIWGVGGEEWIADALQSQAKAKKMHAACLEMARRVDKRQLLDDLDNGLILGNRDGFFGCRDLVNER